MFGSDLKWFLYKWFMKSDFHIIFLMFGISACLRMILKLLKSLQNMDEMIEIIQNHFSIWFYTFKCYLPSKLIWNDQMLVLE